MSLFIVIILTVWICGKVFYPMNTAFLKLLYLIPGGNYTRDLPEHSWVAHCLCTVVDNFLNAFCVKVLFATTSIASLII